MPHNGKQILVALLCCGSTPASAEFLVWNYFYAANPSSSGRSVPSDLAVLIQHQMVCWLHNVLMSGLHPSKMTTTSSSFFFYHIILQIWKIMFATDFTSSECFLSAFYCVKQRPGKPESIYFVVMKFFMVTLTTKATAILGALRTFVCPLLWAWKVNLYRTRSHLVWDSTLSEYKCRLNWGENVDK